MPIPYQVDLLTPRQKLQVQLLIGVWAIAAIYFLIWWFRPSHFTDLGHFVFNSFIVLWNIILPAYYFYFLRRTKKPNPAIEIPAQWRIAIVATRAPSESFELVKKILLAMKAQDLKADVWLADEDPTPAIYAWCKAENVFVSTRKGIPAYHQAEWPRRTRCKEGNLAYFYDYYGYERYDFVAQMDADHIPVTSYLRNMIRPFVDPEIGYVSAPSICDANAKNSWIARGRLYLESPWQGALQAGCNNGYVSMCIGSHYAVRTKALKEAGGLGPELAEDHSTTLLLTAAGWKGVHSIDAEAHGDGPATFADGITQEFQWARSLVMILLQTTPVYFGKIKTPRLKFQFLFGQLWYFGFSFAMLCAFSLPLLALAQGKPFANVSYLSFMLHLAAPALSSYFVVTRIKKWGFLRPVNGKILSWEVVAFQLARWPWVLYAIFDALRSVFLNVKLDWKVTPKGKSKTFIAIRFFIPYAAIFCLSMLVIIVRWKQSQIEFFYLATLNAICYLALSCAIITLHSRENGTILRNG